jgi:hypothetical protein
MVKKVSDLKGLPKDIAFVGAALVSALWAAQPLAVRAGTRPASFKFDDAHD